jgi:hypothetical protein
MVSDGGWNRRGNPEPSLDTRVVSDTHLLLLVHLPGVHQFFDRARTQEPKHLDIARLANSEGSVDCL